MDNIYQYGALARLGKIEDNITRKVTRLQTKFVSIPTECLRLSVKKTKEGDNITSTIKSADICHIDFPQLKDIKLRTIKKDQGTYYAVSSLIDAYADESVKSFYTIQSAEPLDVNDLICRCMFSENPNEPINLLILEIVDVLGTFGISSLTKKSYSCTLFTQDLNTEILKMIADFAERRRKVGY
jgi:hypothetical protein